MTGFEYFSVAVSVVLSFGALRLLDSLPHVFAPGRRYWIHGTWVLLALLMHLHVWWIYWGYVDVVRWTYLRFVLVIAPPAILYALAGTLITRDPGAVASWSEHFWTVRVRVFVTLALLVAALAFAGWVVRGIPLRSPLRGLQAAAIASWVLGAASRNRALHAVLAVAGIVSLLLIGAALTLRPSSLP